MHLCASPATLPQTDKLNLLSIILCVLRAADFISLNENDMTHLGQTETK